MAEIFNKNIEEEKELLAQVSHMFKEEKQWDGETGSRYELEEYLRGSPFGC